MKIIIKNPAPLGANQQKWGDYHFGRCLGKYLQRLGAEVETHYHPEWDRADRADMVLVLRGKHQYRPSSDTVNLLWCMSNPSTITARECNNYDAVCVASVKHAALLRKQVTVAVHPLLQCTDLEAFEQPDGTKDRSGFVFVGNSRGVRRPCVDWAIDFGLELKIIGRGWRDWNLQDWVVADYMANEDLPRLYREARLSLNDHWQDMKALGYVNNRIFDCLAAGLPIFSDDFPELRHVCGDALLYYSDQASFNASLTEALLGYPSIVNRQRSFWHEIRNDFSFEQRAAFLFDLAVQLGKRRRRKTISTRSASPSPATAEAAQSARLDYIEKLRRSTPEGVFCPLCGTLSESFLPDGVVQKRENAKCPNCGSLERHRLFWLYFINELWSRLPRGLKQLLHIAPEEQIAKLLHENAEINYLSGDLMMPNVMVKLDLTALDFPNNRFHVIICSHILEHIPDANKAMAEMYRVTKPGGYTLVQVPIHGKHTYEDLSITDPQERLQQYGQVGHVRKYGEDIAKRLQAVGFEVRARRPRDGLTAETARFLNVHNQLIYECGKPGLPDA